MSRSLFSTSTGSERKTGPVGWASAVFTARRTMRGRSSRRCASVDHLVYGRATGGRSDQRIGSVTVKHWSCWPAVSSIGEPAL